MAIEGRAMLRVLLMYYFFFFRGKLLFRLILCERERSHWNTSRDRKSVV